MQDLLLRVVRYFSYIVIVLTVWFLWPRELDSNTGGISGVEEVPEYAMVNAHYVSVKNSRLDLEMYSKEAIFHLQKKQINCNDIIAYFYDDKNERTKVTSTFGTYYMGPRTLNLVGQVDSESPDGFITHGTAADYFVEKKLLIADKPVQGETEDKEIKIWGDRAESNINENKTYLYGNARTHYIEPKRGLTKVRGDSAQLDRNAEEVKFFNNVKVEQENTIGTGQNASLYYSRDARSLKYMSLNENVRIEDEDTGRYTRSQVAEFFGPTDTIVLTGFPAVYDGDDAVTGDKITLYRSTGIVEVTSTNAAGHPKPGASGPGLTKEDEELMP